jgi:hypothetical protein
MRKYYRTIDQELESRGISEVYFNAFYNNLKQTKVLPSSDIVPWTQYSLIVDYLRKENVLGINASLVRDGLKLFEARKETEFTREFLKVLRDPSSAGGMLPCRTSSLSENAGGMIPCRGDDDD